MSWSYRATRADRGTPLAYDAVMRALAAALATLALGAAGCGEDNSSSKGSGSESSASSRVTCSDVQPPKPKPNGGERRPDSKLDPGRTYTATLRTSCGDIAIRLDARASPRTAASFVALARHGFFEGTAFHRIVPGFVIQGGDPTGTGSGGPGYTTRDVPPKDTLYTRGVVAMAKAADEPPGTAGSQFYIVTARDAGLPPEYALLGKVVKGLDVAEHIDRLGDRSSGEQGTPLQTVTVDRVVVRAS
jgi:peptidyl-prolyl cis-trans isomerase B (cyclophilin B)